MLSKVDIETKLQEIRPILIDKFQVSKIGYFGSFGSGQQTENSDLDILVEFSGPADWEEMAKDLMACIGVPDTVCI